MPNGAATSPSTSRTSTTTSSRSTTRRAWDDVPDDIKTTFDRLGIPEAEKKFLAGVKAQYESEVVYGSLQEDLAKQGRDLHRHRFGRARISGPGPRVLRHDHSARRQQVRRAQLGRLVGRIVHLRPARA